MFPQVQLSEGSTTTEAEQLWVCFPGDGSGFAPNGLDTCSKRLERSDLLMVVAAATGHVSVRPVSPGSTVMCVSRLSSSSSSSSERPRVL